jgi:hypothetical protein
VDTLQPTGSIERLIGIGEMSLEEVSVDQTITEIRDLVADQASAVVCTEAGSQGS